MNNLKNKMQKALKAGELGVTALEYALIAALIAVAIITAVTNAGTGVSNTFQDVADEMPK